MCVDGFVGFFVLVYGAFSTPWKFLPVKSIQLYCFLLNLKLSTNFYHPLHFLNFVSISRLLKTQYLSTCMRMVQTTVIVGETDPRSS